MKTFNLLRHYVHNMAQEINIFRKLYIVKGYTTIMPNILRLSDFFPPTKPERRVHGTCVLCGRDTHEGHPVKFSANFTAWNLLHAGNCICQNCYTIIHNQEYRRKSWVATKEGIKFLSRKEILPTLLKPPEPPFSIYITKSGKKQGFIQLMNRVSTSRDGYYMSFEDSLILVDRVELTKMVEVAKKARELKFTKSDLVNPPVKRWEHVELCKQILRYNKNPVWEVVVYAVD